MDDLVLVQIPAGIKIVLIPDAGRGHRRATPGHCKSPGRIGPLAAALFIFKFLNQLQHLIRIALLGYLQKRLGFLVGL